MSPQDRHSDKEVREALAYVEANGWTIEKKRGHAWGVARCGYGCKISIFSTPRSAGNHAKQIRQAVSRCPHREGQKRTKR